MNVVCCSCDWRFKDCDLYFIFVISVIYAFEGLRKLEYFVALRVVFSRYKHGFFNNFIQSVTYVRILVFNDIRICECADPRNSFELNDLIQHHASIIRS